ncbi:MAG: hypothetical protein AAF340_07805 [Pseudomonadota bacterium]
MGESKIGTEEDVVAFANGAEVFRAKQQELSKQVGNQITQVDQSLIHSNTLMLSVLVSVIDRTGKRQIDNPEGSELNRAAIIADFCKSIAGFELCISSGLYGAASTLARRELEAVNNCFALRRGEQKDRTNPRVKPFKHLNAIYKELSGIAHNTHRDGMLQLSGGSPANLDPIFDLERTENLLMTHIHCVCGIALEAASLSPASENDVLNEREKHYCALALGVLVKKGFLKSFNLGGLD